MLVCSAANVSSATEALPSEVRSNLQLWAGGKWQSKQCYCSPAMMPGFVVLSGFLVFDG